MRAGAKRHAGVQIKHNIIVLGLIVFPGGFDDKPPTDPRRMKILFPGVGPLGFANLAPADRPAAFVQRMSGQFIDPLRQDAQFARQLRIRRQVAHHCHIVDCRLVGKNAVGPVAGSTIRLDQVRVFDHDATGAQFMKNSRHRFCSLLGRVDTDFRPFVLHPIASYH